MSPITPTSKVSDCSVLDESLGAPSSTGESPKDDKDQSTVLLINNGVANHLPKSGTVVRYDCPLPFFLRNEVFDTFQDDNYSWDSDESITVLLKQPNKASNEAIVIASGISRRAEVDYSIGGCPLECPFDPNEDFEEALVIESVPTVFGVLRIPSKLLPFNINEGNNAIRRIADQEKPYVEQLHLVEGAPEIPWQKEKATPVVALVDVSQQKGFQVFVGMRKKLCNFALYSPGKFSPDESYLKMDEFLWFHENNEFTFDNRPVNSSMAHAIYEKLHGQYKSDGKVYIEFVYKNPIEMFQLPPEDAKCKLGIKALPGDANPWAKNLWSEVEDLERWINILSNCSSNVGMGADTSTFLNASVADVVDDQLSETGILVRNLLAKEPAVDLHTASSIDFSDSLDMVLQRVINQERADSDFTDKLWSILAKCGSIEELQDCLGIVFKVVGNKMYRPYLLLTNTTTMANVLTAAMKGEIIRVLELRQKSTMVKALVEIGLHKLFKDYNFALAMSHLIGRGEIDNFSPNTSQLAQSLVNLKKLHCVLEVMCLTKERLNLSVNIQNGHAKKMLKRFDPSNDHASTFDWNKVYHLDVLPTDIRGIMTGLHPFYFKVKMETNTKLKWTRTSVIASTEKYFEYRKDPLEEKYLRQYYLYFLYESGRLGL